MTNVALVTGVTGFVGSNLARRLLAEGWEVHGIIRAGSSLDAVSDLKERCVFHVCDASSGSVSNALSASRPDVVFHLASLYVAEHKSDDVVELLTSNVIFATQLLEAMVQISCKRIINTGTAWQHYHTELYRPVNLYAATKQAFEDILAYYHDAHGLSCLTLKLHDTYGANDKRRKLIKIIVDAAKNNESLDMSPGDQIIDLCHIDDVIDCFIGAAGYLFTDNKPSNETYFVFGERMSIKDLVLLVSDVFKVQMKVNFGGRPYRNREVMFLPVMERKSMPWTSRGEKKSLASELAKFAST